MSDCAAIRSLDTFGLNMQGVSSSLRHADKDGEISHIFNFLKSSRLTWRKNVSASHSGNAQAMDAFRDHNMKYATIVRLKC